MRALFILLADELLCRISDLVQLRRDKLYKASTHLTLPPLAGC